MIAVFLELGRKFRGVQIHLSLNTLAKHCVNDFLKAVCESINIENKLFDRRLESAAFLRDANT